MENDINVVIFTTSLSNSVKVTNCASYCDAVDTKQLFGLLSAPSDPQPSASDLAGQSPTLCALQIYLLTYTVCTGLLTDQFSTMVL